MINLLKGLEATPPIVRRTVKREDAIALARVTKDRNAVHHDPEVAARLNLRDVLVIGTYLSTAGSQIPHYILNLLRGKNPLYNFLDQEVTWEGKTFPGDEISWRCEDNPGIVYDRTTGIVTVNTIAEVENATRARIVTRLSVQRPIVEPVEDKRLVYEEEIEINQNDTREYKRITGESEFFTAAIIPGSLVAYTEKLNQSQGTNYIALNAGMRSRFVEPLRMTGDTETLEIKVYENPARHRIKNRTAAYGFRTIASQQGRIVVDTEIQGFIKGHFDNLYALRPDTK